MDDFKTKGMLAEPYFVMTFYEELLQNKNLALLRGDIINSNGISQREAQGVTSLMISFYMTEGLFNDFVYPFNKDPNKFNYDKFTKMLNISKN